MFQRFAVYFVPDGALGRFGAEWLGWDIARGKAVLQPVETALDLPAISERPRRYGFHATLKPPFRLAEDASLSSLETAFGALCAAFAPVTLPGLQLERMGRFLALKPSRPTPALTVLAAEVVRGLDRFRAPPEPEELARRRKGLLSPAQEDNLRRWGYPHVMEQFRFHLTLTGALPDTARDSAQAVLARRLDGMIQHPLCLSHLSLVGEDSGGWFHEVNRVRLSAT